MNELFRTKCAFTTFSLPFYRKAQEREEAISAPFASNIVPFWMPLEAFSSSQRIGLGMKFNLFFRRN